MRIVEKITIDHPLGLSLRSTAEIVQTAARFHSRIHVRKDDLLIDCKSILGLMTLHIVNGTELQLEVEGNDARLALESIRQFFRREPVHGS